MAYSYADIIARVQLVTGKHGEKVASPGRIAEIIDLGVERVYNLLDTYGHPYIRATATLTVTGTYSDLPSDLRRIVKIEDERGERVFRRYETGGVRGEYDLVSPTRIQWYPVVGGTRVLILHYIKKHVRPATLTATIEVPESAYDYLMYHALGVFTRDPVYLSESSRAWEILRSIAYDETEPPRVFKREARM